MSALELLQAAVAGHPLCGVQLLRTCFYNKCCFWPRWSCFKLQLRDTPSGVCNSCGHAFITNVASGRAGAASSCSCGTPLVGCATLADMLLACWFMAVLGENLQ